MSISGYLESVLFQFNWHNYISGIMGMDSVEVSVTEAEPIVVRAVPYFQKIFDVFQNNPKKYV